MPDYDIPNRADIPAAPQIVKCAAMDSAIVRFARSCEQRGQGSRCEDESGRFDARAASRFKNSLLGRPASDRPWGDVAEWERAMGILETTYPLLPRPEPVKKGRKN